MLFFLCQYIFGEVEGTSLKLPSGSFKNMCTGDCVTELYLQDPKCAESAIHRVLRFRALLLLIVSKHVPPLTSPKCWLASVRIFSVGILVLRLRCPQMIFCQSWSSRGDPLLWRKWLCRPKHCDSETALTGEGFLKLSLHGLAFWLNCCGFSY